ncbi:hypothetical protein Bhyg_13932 [Pseudolycoriella hygida]|uniref:Uncharacterized protein n=1 Tax=Pseudolycoriella hygida TaxID=35572 RepID=A0A9Q0MS77_9DIPT|nr:hypothetical protein Bhyg_13932 [Pseudolycoriella hygida]
MSFGNKNRRIKLNHSAMLQTPEIERQNKPLFKITARRKPVKVDEDPLRGRTSRVYRKPSISKNMEIPSNESQENDMPNNQCTEKLQLCIVVDTGEELGECFTKYLTPGTVVDVNEVINSHPAYNFDLPSLFVMRRSKEPGEGRVLIQYENMHAYRLDGHCQLPNLSDLIDMFLNDVYVFSDARDLNTGRKSEDINISISYSMCCNL